VKKKYEKKKGKREKQGRVRIVGEEQVSGW